MVQESNFIKVKSHADCFSTKWLTSVLRKVATPMLPKIPSIFPGPNEYGSLQPSRIKASFRSQVAEDKLNVPLPHRE